MAFVAEQQATEKPVEADSTFDLTSLAQALEGEEEEEPTVTSSSTSLLDLPTEIRYHIYSWALLSPRRPLVLRKFTLRPTTTGKSSLQSPILRRQPNLFLTCRQIHDEATHYLFSSQTFRLFPMADMSDTPPLHAVHQRYKPLVTTGQIVFGPNWTAPPSPSVIDDGRLGLPHVTGMRLLKVLVTCDPSHPAFAGFRISETYYTDYAGKFLAQVLVALPSVQYVEFDAFSSVEKSGPLMSRLIQVVNDSGRRISWGPMRGWSHSSGS